MGKIREAWEGIRAAWAGNREAWDEMGVYGRGFVCMGGN
jgi:hypothetical protein